MSSGTPKPGPGEPVRMHGTLIGVDVTPSAGEGPDEVVLVIQGVSTQEEMDALGLTWDAVIEPQTFAKVRVKFLGPPTSPPIPPPPEADA